MPTNNSCEKLNEKVKLEIKNLGNSVGLEEGRNIYEEDYFVVPTDSGGLVLKLKSIKNYTEGYSSDQISFIDAITGESYQATIISEGIGTLNLEKEILHINYYEEIYLGDYVIITWGEGASHENVGNKKETFYDCAIQNEFCSDSDVNTNFLDGINAYQKGIVIDITGDYTDYCVDGLTATESGLEIPIESPRVFVHEMGHLFGHLQDEYLVYGSGKHNLPPESQPERLISCWVGEQHTQEECVGIGLWNHLIGAGCGQNDIIDCEKSDKNYNLEIGCFEGCFGWEFGAFRSARNTIMRNPHIDSYSFGLWNEEILMEEINKFEEN